MPLLFSVLPKPPVLLTTLSITVLLSACGGSSSDDDKQENTQTNTPHGPIFDPANAKIPSTNDLLFKGSTDGTLNIPNPSNNAFINAVNQLDGFSTSIPINADFDMPLASSSLTIGDSIHIFEVTKNQQGAITSIIKELSNTEINVTAIGDNASTLALIPLTPLKESSSYLIILTNKIKDPDGKAAKAPAAYLVARSTTPLTGTNSEDLEPLRLLVNNMENIATSADIEKNDIILSWSFTTQSITPVLQQLADNTTASELVIAPTNKTTQDFKASLAGMADVSIGTLEIPYYLEAPSTENPTANLTGYWKGLAGSTLTRFNTTPIATSRFNTPVIMTTPNADSGQTKPTDGWPILIYQHGITRNRLDMLVYADSLAKAGFAMIGIDLPLHGIVDNKNPLHANNTSFPTDIEATFDVDFKNNQTGAAEPDGIIDDSGEHFINLRSFLTARDNIRQGVANLLALRHSLENIPDINSDKIGLIAHSLGGIIAVPYLAVEDKSMRSSLLTTGASISTILRDSNTFAPPIKTALAKQGITGADYQAFLLGSQWVLDSADPINFAKQAANTHRIQMSEVVGNGGDIHLPDQTVPNSSTEILAKVLGATPANKQTNPITLGNPKIVRFTQGNHSSILSPTRGAPAGGSYLNVFTEMHKQLAQFHTGTEANLVITNLGIVLK